MDSPPDTYTRKDLDSANRRWILLGVTWTVATLIWSAIWLWIWDHYDSIDVLNGILKETATDSKAYFRNELIQLGFQEDLALRIANSLVIIHKDRAQGSWFFIHPRIILTAEHVIDWDTPFNTVPNGIFWVNGKSYTWKKIYLSTEHDIGIVIIEEKNPDFLKMSSKNPDNWDDITTLWFPWGKPTVTQGKRLERFKNLEIAAADLDKNNIKDGEEVHFISQLISRGNSWWPILSADGTVWGIAVQRRSWIIPVEDWDIEMLAILGYWAYEPIEDIRSVLQRYLNI